MTNVEEHLEVIIINFQVVEISTSGNRVTR